MDGMSPDTGRTRCDVALEIRRWSPVLTTAMAAVARETSGILLTIDVQSLVDEAPIFVDDRTVAKKALVVLWMRRSWRKPMAGATSRRRTFGVAPIWSVVR